MKRHGKRWDDWILPLASCTESNTRTKYSGCFPHGVSRTKTTEWLFPRAGDPSQPADCAPDGFRVGTEEIRCPYLPPASPLGVATHIVVALCSFAVALCLAWLVAVAELPKRLALCVPASQWRGPEQPLRAPHSHPAPPSPFPPPGWEGYRWRCS